MSHYGKRGVSADFIGRARRPRHDENRAVAQNVPLVLPFNDDPEFSRETLLKELHDEALPQDKRILAAMSLSSLDRVERSQPIDLVCAELRLCSHCADTR